MFNIETVIKNNGKIEAFSPEKLNKWAIWACGDRVDLWSQLVSTAAKKINANQVPTSVLQNSLITSAIDLLGEDHYYSKVASKLLLSDLRKKVFGEYHPPKFSEYYKQMVNKGLYASMNYSDDALEQLSEVIRHERDSLFDYAGMRQIIDKYLIKVNGEILETPQMLYMALSMAAFEGEPLEDVIDFYHAISLHKINLPTPVLMGLRTLDKGFASCCVISAGDSIDSMEAAAHIAHKMTANRAGIGIEFETRSINDSVKGGRVKHQGKVPYYKWISAVVKADTQQGRGGSATVQFSFIDPEIETLLRMRSQRVAEDSRVDDMDYSMAFNMLLIKRYLKNENITLMGVKDAPEVHKALYSGDTDAFEKLYVAQEKRGMYKQIPAAQLIEMLMTQRADTGRIYWHNVTWSNRRSTFKDPIRLSNLCQEITLPTAPFKHVVELYHMSNTEGEVALCNLAGWNSEYIFAEDSERIAYLIVKAVDRVIDIQSYPFSQMEITTMARRNIGIGIINLAYSLAKRGLSYQNNEGRTFMHQLAERFSFLLHKASVKLARERGACEWFSRTKYADGILPIDTYPKYVDNFHNASLQCDWESLREDIKRYGIRNSVLEACMPSESSSVVIGCTNGIEPIREPITYKASRYGAIPQLAPDIDELEFDYEYAYDLENIEFMRSIGVLQKFIGQSISANSYYDYNKYPGNKIPMKTLIGDFLECAKLGIKTAYYCNTDVSTGGSVHNYCEGCNV